MSLFPIFTVINLKMIFLKIVMTVFYIELMVSIERDE